jgi:hypothetical protein
VTFQLLSNTWAVSIGSYDRERLGVDVSQKVTFEQPTHHLTSHFF